MKIQGANRPQWIKPCRLFIAQKVNPVSRLKYRPSRWFIVKQGPFAPNDGGSTLVGENGLDFQRNKTKALWWRHVMEIFPCCWTIVCGIHRPNVDFPRKVSVMQLVSALKKKYYCIYYGQMTCYLCRTRLMACKNNWMALQIFVPKI